MTVSRTASVILSRGLVVGGGGAGAAAANLEECFGGGSGGRWLIVLLARGSENGSEEDLWRVRVALESVARLFDWWTIADMRRVSAT